MNNKILVFAPFLCFAVFLSGCGTLNTTSSLYITDYYKDTYNGFQVYRPAGWSVETSAGNVLVKEDSAGLTAALIYPVRLTGEGNALTAKQFMGLYFGAVSNVTSGSLTSVLSWAASSESDDNNSSGSFTGKINGTDVQGVISSYKYVIDTQRNLKGMLCKLYWAPTTSFNDKKGTLQRIADSYDKLANNEIEGLLSAKVVGSGAGTTTWKISYPTGWVTSEVTYNGVNLHDADSTELVGYSAVYPNSYTPAQLDSYSLVVLASAGATSITTLFSKSDYPANVPDSNGNYWNFICREVSYIMSGKNMITLYYIGTTFSVDPYGQPVAGIAMTSGMSATADKWDSVKDKLAMIQSKIMVLSTGSVRNMIYPKNQPTDTSSIMSSWEQRNNVDGKLSDKRRESIMGYDTMVDSHGDLHDEPFNNWDAAIGGYSDPTNPGHLMTPWVQ